MLLLLLLLLLLLVLMLLPLPLPLPLLLMMLMLDAASAIALKTAITPALIWRAAAVAAVPPTPIAGLTDGACVGCADGTTGAAAGVERREWTPELTARWERRCKRAAAAADATELCDSALSERVAESGGVEGVAICGRTERAATRG